MQLAGLLMAMGLIAAVSPDSFPDEVQELLGNMTKEVILHYFVKARCLAIVSENNHFQDYIHPLEIPIFFVQLPFSKLKYSKRITPDSEFEEYAWESFLLPPLDAGCLPFVIQTNEISLMVKAFARLAHSPKSTYRANRRFLYLPSEPVPNNDFEKNIKELYRRREMDFMPDVVIAKVVNDVNTISSNEFLQRVYEGDADNTSSDFHVELLTHNYVGPDPSQRVTLDIWTPSEGFLLQKNLYPDKMSNLMGKHLMVTSFSYPPVSVVNADVDPPVYDGLEFKIIDQWSKVNNFTWGVWYRPEEGWSIIWNNGSGLGLTGNVASDTVDVGFGAIYLWERDHLYVDYSTIYFTTSLTAVVPKPKLLPGWTVIVSPFSFNMWIAFGVAILFNSVLIYTIAKASAMCLGRGASISSMYSTLDECAFRNIGLLVLQVPSDERVWSTPRYVPMRHLVTWLIFFYFVASTAYCGGLATVLTLPRYEKPIDTCHDMADHNVKWGSLDECFVAFLKDSYDPKMRIMASNNIVESEEYFEKIIYKGDLGFTMEKMQNGHFAMAPFINYVTMQNLRLLSEYYVQGHCAYALRKGSPYLQIMNPLLGKLRDAGIILFWEDTTVRIFMDKRDQLAVMNSRKEPENTPKQLYIRHLTGSFFLLFGGLSLATMAFFLENMKHHWGSYLNGKYMKNISTPVVAKITTPVNSESLKNQNLPKNNYTSSSSSSSSS